MYGSAARARLSLKRDCSWADGLPSAPPSLPSSRQNTEDPLQAAPHHLPALGTEHSMVHEAKHSSRGRKSQRRRAALEGRRAVPLPPSPPSQQHTTHTLERTSSVLRSLSSGAGLPPGERSGGSARHSHGRHSTQTLSEALIKSAKKMLSAHSESEKVKTLSRVVSMTTHVLNQKLEAGAVLPPTGAGELSGAGESPRHTQRVSSSSANGGAQASHMAIVAPSAPSLGGGPEVDEADMMPRIVTRQCLSYHTRQRDNGLWQATVSLVQPFVHGLWTDPQGTRPSHVSLGFFEVEEDAVGACRNSAPPVWAEVTKGGRCSGCTRDLNKGFSRGAKHCRNCGQVVCKACSRNSWPFAMVPPTYHNNERNVRVCHFCHQLALDFRCALREGAYDRARELHATGNVNTWCPFMFEHTKEYPVHCAAEGGNLRLLQWLVDDLKCALYTAEGSPLLTHAHDTVLGVATRFKHVHVMRWLLTTKGCRSNEISDKGQLWMAVDLLLRQEAAHARSRRTTPGSLPSLPPLARPRSCVSQRPSRERASAPALATARPAMSGLVYSATESRGVTGKAVLNECIVCMERDVDSVLVPCGHVCCCKTCASSFSWCPVCRVPVDRILRTYSIGGPSGH